MGNTNQRLVSLERGQGIGVGDPGICACRPNVPCSGAGPIIVWALDGTEECDDPAPVCSRCGLDRRKIIVEWGYDSGLSEGEAANEV
jgi:hypothetical protein